MMKEDYFEFILSEVEGFRAEGRASSCRTRRSALRGFKEATGLRRLSPDRLTRRLLIVYKEWLLRRGMSSNTINAYLGALQASYNRMTMGSPYHVYGLFSGLRPGTTSTVKRAVSERTMSRLLQTDFDGLPADLHQSFAWFLLIFYLRGIPFVDLAHLRKTDLQEGVITYRRRKTGRQLVVQVPPEALVLLMRYAAQCPDSPYLLPILQGDATTPEAAYRDYDSALRQFNNHLKKLTVVLRTEVRLSSYTARHSWATIAYHRGIAVGIISKALGHSSIRVTEFYLKPFENSVIDKTNRQIIRGMKKAFELKSLAL